MNNNYVAVCLAVLGLMTTYDAHADDGDFGVWDISVDSGRASYSSIDIAPPQVGQMSLAYSSSTDPLGLGLHFGASFVGLLGLDISYWNLGTAHYTYNDISQLNTSANVDVGMQGIGLDYYFAPMPFPSVRLIVRGKIGAAETYLKRDATLVVGGISSEQSHTANNLSLNYGLGLGYSFQNNVQIGLEWEQFVGVGDSRTGTGNVNYVHVGLTYLFQ